MGTRNLFEEKAEPKAMNIMNNYGYCIVTPLECINEFGDCMELEPIKCTDIIDVRTYYHEFYDIMIQTPNGDNY